MNDIQLTVLYFWIFWALIAGCEPEEDHPRVIQKVELSSVEIQKVDSIVLDSGDQMIGQFRSDMRVNKAGTILSFADLMNQQIYLFGMDGKLINIIGNSGSGPKEFLQIMAHFVADDRVIVVDESTMLVKIFSIDGELINTFKLFKDRNLLLSWWDMDVVGNDMYLSILEPEYSNMDVSKSAMIAKVDLETGEVGPLVGQYDPVFKKQSTYFYYQHFTLGNDEMYLYTSPRTSPHIQIYNLQSNRRVDYFFVSNLEGWNQLQEKVTPEMPRNLIKEIVSGTSGIQGLHVSDKYVLQSFQTITDEFYQTFDHLAKKNYMAVYDKAGKNYYGTIRLPGLLGGVHDGKLYIIEDTNPDNYTIGVYEFEITQ